MDFDQFSIALLSLRDDAPALTEAEGLALQDAHLDHVARLHEAGKLIGAGPVGGDSPYIGLSIFTVGVDEARELNDADPAVIAGRFAVQVLPWQVPAGAVTHQHTRFPHSVADVRGG